MASAGYYLHWKYVLCSRQIHTIILSMKNIDILLMTTIGLLLFMVCLLFKQTKDLQTQIEEIRIVVNHKYVQVANTEKKPFRFSF